MRFTIGTLIAAGVLAVTAAPSGQAQSTGFMWCAATATNGADTTRYYSPVFQADSGAAAAKAQAFKAAVADDQISAASVTARCFAAPTAAAAQAALAAARQSAPGEAADAP